MKTITMYELLGLVKDGKAPKKVKYQGEILYFDDETKNYYNDEGMHSLFDCVGYMLNYEVEILEEKKIPEKLSTWFSVELTQSDEENVDYANTNFENMYEKINEICDYLDYLKSKGNE